MTLAYVYKWTELATGKWYVGASCEQGQHPERYSEGTFSHARKHVEIIL